MIGTITPNIFDRLAVAFGRATKALPPPGALYQNQGIGPNMGGPITWPGWDKWERDRGGAQIDYTNTKTAVQSAWAYANANAIANEFSSSEMIVKERKADKLEDVANHPLELLWESPNPHMGRSFVMSFWAQSYTYVGKAYLYWLPNSAGEIAEVWPIPPFMVAPHKDRKQFIDGYLFRSRPDADPIFIKPEYVTYSHNVNLFDVYDGMSFLVATMLAIKGDISASQWNLNYFAENNGMPDAFLGVPQDTLDVDLQRIRLELRDFFGGTRRGVAVGRANDLKYTQFGRSQKDMEFQQGREFASREIGRAMGFPDGYWSETANRANAEQARATMIAGAVWPLLVRLAEDLNAGFMKRWYGEQYRAEFKDIRPEDRQLKIAETSVRTQYWTINELREADGKDPLDDPRGEMFVAEITKGTPIPATPASDQTEEAISKMEDEAGMGEDDAVAEATQDAGGEVPEAEPAGADIFSKSLPITPTLLEDAGYTKQGDEWIAPPSLIKHLMTPTPAARAEMERLGLLDAAGDLDRWERKALKRLKDKGSAAAPFESVAISAAEHERISTALKAATTPAEVRAAFRGVDEVIDLVGDEALAWAKRVMEGE